MPSVIFVKIITAVSAFLALVSVSSRDGEESQAILSAVLVFEGGTI